MTIIERLELPKTDDDVRLTDRVRSSIRNWPESYELPTAMMLDGIMYIDVLSKTGKDNITISSATGFIGEDLALGNCTYLLNEHIKKAVAGIPVS